MNLDELIPNISDRMDYRNKMADMTLNPTSKLNKKRKCLRCRILFFIQKILHWKEIRNNTYCN